MVKIERLLDGAVAAIERDGKELQLFQGQLITLQDLQTLKVVGGKLIYSVYETDVVEVIGIPATTGAKPTVEIEEIVAVTEPVEPKVSKAKK